MSIVRFSDVACRANTKEDRFNTDKIYYVGGEHIESGELFVSNKGIIKGSTIGPMFYCGFKAGQILFVTRNPHLKKCGIAEFDGICSEKTFVIETKDSDVLLQEYLALIMQSNDFWDYCEENKSGGVNYFLNWSTLADYEFDLPPLEEQKLLADKLWAAYRLKESYKKLLAATEEMVKSQFIEMFKSTDYVQLNSLVTLSKSSIMPQNGSIYTLYSFPAYDNNQTPEIVDGREIKSSKIVLEENVVLFNKLNVRLSRVWNIHCLSTKNNICSSEFLPLKVKNSSVISQSFLYRILCSDYVTKKMMDCSTGTSNSQKRITPSSLMNMNVPLPSIDEQQKFVAIANQADKSGFELRKSIKLIDKVIKTLINNV